MTSHLRPLAKKFLLHRPKFSTFLLFFLVAGYILIIDNRTYFALADKVFENHPFQAAVFAGIAFTVIFFTLALISLPYVEKPVLALLLLRNV